MSNIDNEKRTQPWYPPSIAEQLIHPELILIDGEENHWTICLSGSERSAHTSLGLKDGLVLMKGNPLLLQNTVISISSQ